MQLDQRSWFTEFLEEAAAYWQHEAEQFDALARDLSNDGDVVGAAHAEGARDTFWAMSRSYRRAIVAEVTA